MCPVSVSDTSNFVIKRFRLGGAEETAARPAAEPGSGRHAQGPTQFMTEKGRRFPMSAPWRPRPNGSVSAPTALSAGSSTARNGFCSHADADVAVPAGAAQRRSARDKGAGHVSPLPRRLEDGSRKQLPDRAAEGQARHAPPMASGEIILDGCRGLPGGRREPGFQTDDGAGESFAAEPRRARRRDDAPPASTRRWWWRRTAAAFGRAIGDYPPAAPAS